MRVSIILIGLGLVLGLSTNVQAVDPDIKCRAAKVKEAAKYSACRLKAESKAIKKGEVPDFSKCDSKFSEKWQKAESKAGGECPTENDEAAIQAQVQQCADDLVAALDPNSCSGAAVGGTCWYLGALNANCTDTCAAAGLVYDSATATYAGSSGTDANCAAVLDALGVPAGPVQALVCQASAVDCNHDTFGNIDSRFRCTNAGGEGFAYVLAKRACACMP